MKKQNQASEAAKKIREGYGIEEWHDSMGSDPIADIIQHCIDAATAEVKKEEKEMKITRESKEVTMAETPATMDVVSEQTGDPFLRIAKVLEAVFDREKGALRLFDVERGKVYATHLGKNLSGQGSEVPTQKAPTDSSREKENASCLAARVEPTKEEEK